MKCILTLVHPSYVELYLLVLGQELLVHRLENLEENLASRMGKLEQCSRLGGKEVIEDEEGALVPVDSVC